MRRKLEATEVVRSSLKSHFPGEAVKNGISSAIGNASRRTIASDDSSLCCLSTALETTGSVDQIILVLTWNSNNCVARDDRAVKRKHCPPEESTTSKRNECVSCRCEPLVVDGDWRDMDRWSDKLMNQNVPPAIFSTPALAQSLRMSSGRALLGTPRISARFLTPSPRERVHQRGKIRIGGCERYSREPSMRFRSTIVRAALLAMAHPSSIELAIAGKTVGTSIAHVEDTGV